MERKHNMISHLSWLNSIYLDLEKHAVTSFFACEAEYITAAYMFLKPYG